MVRANYEKTFDQIFRTFGARQRQTGFQEALIDICTGQMAEQKCEH